MNPLTTTITSAAMLAALPTAALAERLKENAGDAHSRFLESGKIIAILDRSRGKKTIKKHVAKLCGQDFADAIGHGYKAAIVFGRMVSDKEGNGKIAEADFDKCKISWLIRTSAILNHLVKNAEEIGDAECASIREEVASLLRVREEGTQGALDAIWERINPKEQEEEGGGEGEAEGEGMSDGQNAEEIARLLAQIGELETRLHMANQTVRTLAGITGEFAITATAEQIETLVPQIGELPDTVKHNLAGCLELRVAELGEGIVPEATVSQIMLHLPTGEVLVGTKVEASAPAEVPAMAAA